MNPRQTLSAFSKLIGKRPAALIGYKIAQALSERDFWSDRARQSKCSDVRLECVKRARAANSQLVRALRAL